jgi:hypothetical protein
MPKVGPTAQTSKITVTNETHQGAGGGSEMLYYDVTEQLVAQYYVKDTDQTPIPRWLYYELKRHTVSGVRDILNGGPTQYIACPTLQEREPIVLDLTLDMCHKGFETGFKHVKDMIKQQLRELVKIKNGWGTPAEDHIASIIVSGGSSLHPEFIKWIKALCKSLDLDEPHFTKSMEMQYG